MHATTWLTTLLRTRKQQARQHQTRNGHSGHSQSGWFQTERLEDRTLLSAPEFGFATTYGGISYDNLYDIDVDSNGNVYTIGYLADIVQLDTQEGLRTLNTNGYNDVIFTKMTRNGQIAWARTIGGNFYDVGNGIEVTPDGGVVICGNFNQTVDFDPGPNISTLTARNSDVFFAKFNENGEFQWVNSVGSASADSAYAMTTDSSGNIYATGAYNSTYGAFRYRQGDDFVYLDGNGGHDVFTVKLNPAGEVEWGAILGGNEADLGRGIAVDDSGGVYVAGYFQATADFDPDTTSLNLTSAGKTDLFITKLDSSGNLRWTHGFGTSESDGAFGVETDGDGNVIVIGYFGGTLDFDPGPGISMHTTNGGADQIILKLSTDGDYIWSKQIGGTASDYPYGLAIDSENSVYVTGSFLNVLDFDPDPGIFELDAGDDLDAYVFALNSGGSLKWALNAGGDHTVSADAIAVDSSRNVYIAGLFWGVADFDPGNAVASRSSNGDQDSFVLKLNLLPPTDTDLTISKQSSAVWVTPGDRHTYTVTVSNEGELGVDDAVVFDDPTSFLDNVTWRASLSGGATGSIFGYGPINETVGLPPGNSITYTIRGVIKPGIRDNITNIATISSANTPDPNPSNNRAFESDFIILATDGGSGYFVPGTTFGEADYTENVDLGDIDGDGDLDAVFANVSGGRVWLNDGNANFTATAQTLPNSVNAALGDLDGDGDLDVFLTRTSTSPDEVWLNDGSGHFINSGQAIGNFQSRWVKLGDFNGDGALDAIVSLYYGPSANRLFLNDGTGNFTDSGQNIGLTPGTDHRGLAVGDLDGDGDLDLFSGKYTWGDDDRIYLNDGTGLFVEHQVVSLIGEYTGQVDFGDVDGDGDLDAIVPHGYLSSKILINDGTGTFSLGQVLNNEIDESSSAQFGDFDNDGDLDILIGQSSDEPNLIWLNDGTGQFFDSGQRLGLNHTDFVKLGDLDGDGDLDAVAANYNDQSQVWLNQNVTLPYANDFDEGHWGGLYVKTPQNISVIEESGGNHSFQLDNSGLTGLTTAILATESPLPRTYEMAAKVTSLSGANRWYDGFLIFDYQHENDFKYAGFFTDQNEWVIGHYQGNFDNRVATVDWDNIGKTIDTNRAYQMHLRVDRNQATLHVDGLLVTTATFTRGIGRGKAGLAASNAVTRFDNFEIAESVDTGLPQSLPFSEDFEDGVADGFYAKPNSGWGVVTSPEGKVLRVNNSNNTNLGLMSVPLAGDTPSAFEMSARINSLNADAGWRNGFIIFDYKSDTDFKYAGMFTGQNQWIIGHYQGNFNNRLVTVDWDDTGRAIQSNTFYTVQVRLDGNKIWMSVDGEFIASATFASNVNAPIVGLAAERASTWFDDFQVAEWVGVSYPSDLPYSENYNDGVADQFGFHNPQLWTIGGPASNKYLEINAEGFQGLDVSYFENQFLLPATYDISASVTALTGTQRWLDGFLVFDYQSPTDFKYAGMFTGQNQWIIGHYQGNWNNRIAQVDWDDVGRRIERNRAHLLHVTVDGNEVTLRVNGIEVVSGTFAGGIGDGNVGVAAENAVTRFDDFHVAVDVRRGKPIPLPYIEDFEDGSAEDFFIDRNPTAWGFANYGGNKVLRVNSSNGGGNSVHYLPIDNPNGDRVRISADIRSISSTSWADGFIIFDYKNQNDFKYAGFFTGQSEWIIGHYLGNYTDHRLTTVDWDNQGRKIKFGQFYHLEVVLEGTRATLFVDGELINEVDFNTPITRGPVGLAAANAFTWFDNFQVAFDGPLGTPTADSLFANWDEEQERLLI